MVDSRKSKLPPPPGLASVFITLFSATVLYTSAETPGVARWAGETGLGKSQPQGCGNSSTPKLL